MDCFRSKCKYIAYFPLRHLRNVTPLASSQNVLWRHVIRSLTDKKRMILSCRSVESEVKRCVSFAWVWLANRVCRSRFWRHVYLVLLFHVVKATSVKWSNWRTGAVIVRRLFSRAMLMMKWSFMCSDVNWHIRDKLWPMLTHGSVSLYVHRNRKARS